MTITAHVVQLSTTPGYRGCPWAAWAWSVRPDLWPPGHWYEVAKVDSLVSYAGATYGARASGEHLHANLSRGAAQPGQAEADIMAGRIYKRPWPE